MNNTLSGIVFDKVIGSVLIDYLPTISQIALKRALGIKDNRFEIYNRFYQRCCIFLIKVGKIDGHVFMKYLKDQNLMLSGGFVLSVLLWDNFEHLKDIDVYTRCDHNTESSTDQVSIERCFKEYQELDKVISLNRDTEGYLQKQVDSVYNDYMYSHPEFSPIKLIREATIGEQKLIIQLIALKYVSHEYVTHNFDFDFCKNTFTKDQLRIDHPFNLIKKRCVFDPYKKHLSGFIENGICGGDGLEEYVRKQKQRNRSYKKRGYTIIMDDEVSQVRHNTFKDKVARITAKYGWYDDRPSVESLLDKWTAHLQDMK